MIDKKALGQKGEDTACKALERSGYRVIDKNFRTRQGEIDIVAEDGGTICFIEVKARSSESYGFPEEAVTRRKQRRLYAAALVYLEKNRIESCDLRFDIASVNLRSLEVTILKNAFEIDF